MSQQPRAEPGPAPAASGQPHRYQQRAPDRRTDTLTSPSTHAPAPAHVRLPPCHPPLFLQTVPVSRIHPQAGVRMGCSCAVGGVPRVQQCWGTRRLPWEGLGQGGCALHRGCSGKHPAASWQQPLANLKSPEAGGVNGGVPPAARATQPPQSGGEKGAPCCRAGMWERAPPAAQGSLGRVPGETQSCTEGWEQTL